jgi:group II intron reverse transcriptase/maturase
MSMVGNFPSGSRESPAASNSSMELDRSGKARGHNPDVYATGKSDKLVVPGKSANLGGVPPSSELMEERSLTNEKAEHKPLDRTQNRETDGKPFRPRSRGLLGIREAAQKDKNLKFNNLFSHITPELLRASFLDLKKHAAPGVDGQTWQDYAMDFEKQIEDLHGRLHRGSYRAQPSKRAYIKKADGKQRPLGIAALEDKIVQRATRTILEQIYEESFRGFSYGYRPRRSAHDGLDALVVAIKQQNVNWVLDADIRGFFDNISHDWLMKFLEHRISDQRMLRLLKKWLRAGVSEDGQWTKTEVGTPQGAVISPLLANVYLHYVLDLWIEQWRKRIAKGTVVIVRYADDFVIGFSSEHDARKCLASLKERVTKFGLELHPDKTRLIEFGRYAEQRRKARGDKPPETFDFAGFTHICGKTRGGYFTVHRRTSHKKFQAKLTELSKALLQRCHEDIAETGAWLASVYRGWCQYYAVPGNYVCLGRFQKALQSKWLRVLRRRSQRGRRLTWKKFTKICNRWLPNPKIIHPYPEIRFARHNQR